jgi:hypothetical protein
LNAVDTSVAVAGFVPWHEAHGVCADVLAEGALLPAHAAAETLTVLTCLPDPYRISADDARQMIVETFGDGIVSLPADIYRQLIDVAPRIGIVGGGIFDAVVGATVKHADAILLTRDARATRVYDALAVSWRLVASGR